MKFCSSCGHELGVGRFCTNCGQPVDRSAAPAAPPRPTPAAPDDTLSATDERRAARRHAALTPGPPRTPPTADDTPAPPRFPLFADEVPDHGHDPQGWHGTASDLPPVSEDLAGAPSYTPAYTPPATGPGGASHDEGGGLLDLFAPASTPAPRTPDEAYAALHAAAEPGEQERPGRRRGPWVALLVVVVVVAAVLVWWGTRGGSSADDAGTTGAAGTAGAATGPTAGAAPSSLTSQVDVRVPGHAPPSQETDGDRATFVGTNLLDGRPETAWRVAGDASGEEIVFTFPGEVTISQVGLVNGYAKIAKGQGGRFDWYHGNRTISKVLWVFDDSTQLEQDLERNRRMQTLDVDANTTRTLTLRLLEVSAPGTGRARRDFTAISDVTLSGVPAT